VGPNPTDRGRPGTKHHLVTDAAGLPLAVLITGANVHDCKLFEQLLDSVPAVKGPRGRHRKRPEKLQSIAISVPRPPHPATYSNRGAFLNTPGCSRKPGFRHPTFSEIVTFVEQSAAKPLPIHDISVITLISSNLVEIAQSRRGG